MMNKASVPAGPPDRVWKFFASVRLTVVVLLSLAATSIIGTIIPQNENPAAYYQAYGEFLYRIFSVLDIFDMYHSLWFQFLLLLLTINVVVCSVDRLSATWKIIFTKAPVFHVSGFRRLSSKQEFKDARSLEELKKIYEPFVSRSFGYCRSEPTDKGWCVFAEKGRSTRLGVYAVHLSVILLLIGGLIGSIFGFEGFINIPEGETISSIRIRSTGKLHSLGFQVRCDDFNISYYDSGAPSEYRSTLTVLEGDKPVLKKDIIVNDPLRYKGINMFQSSYGALPPEKVILDFTSKETGMEYKKPATVDQPLNIPENLGTFVIKDHQNSFDFRGHDLGQTLIGILTPKNGTSIEIILPLRFPGFDKMRKGDVVISVTDYTHRYYTGLQVTKDPGVWVVYAGFVLMIIGCFVTFFMSHQRLCIEIIPRGGKCIVTVAGTANKNQTGMQKKVRKISEKLVRLP